MSMILAPHGGDLGLYSLVRMFGPTGPKEVS
jgi:hypothetical protein